MTEVFVFVRVCVQTYTGVEKRDGGEGVGGGVVGGVHGCTAEYDACGRKRARPLATHLPSRAGIAELLLGIVQLPVCRLYPLS